MQPVSRKVALAILMIGFLGCAGTACKRDASSAKSESSTLASARPPTVVPVHVAPNLVTLLRSRRFEEALRVADALPIDERNRPATRMAIAFAALKSGATERAVRELDAIATQLPVVAVDIAKLLAVAKASRNGELANAPRSPISPVTLDKSSGQTKPVVLSRSARLAQLRQSAERGLVDAVDSEVTALTGGSVSALTKAEGLYLRGKARFVARREQRLGAQFLLSAAERGYAKPSQLRFDAARLYVREGDADAATKLYRRVAAADVSRADEALYYAARTQATLGEPKIAAAYYAELLRRFARSRYADEARYERALNGLSMGKYEATTEWFRTLLDVPEAQSNRSTIRELTCVATLKLEQKEKAIDCFRSVVTDYPLHLAGLFARARLTEQAITVESRTMPAEVTPKQLDDSTSPRVKQLVELGLDELASAALESELSAPAIPLMRERRWQCQAFGAIGYGGRGFAISSDLRDRVQLTDQATAENRWAFDCRFPTPYATLVREFEAEFKLPVDLLFAVIRQESGFRPEVTSGANALGLMQLLPETAERLRQELSEPKGTVNLSEPRVNLRLGAAYLRKLLDYFDGNLVLAVAAYNAGPKAVALWVSRSGAIPMELFAARIPYTETRNYVERVLSNLAMYRYLRLGDAGLPELLLNLPKELKLSESLY